MTKFNIEDYPTLTRFLGENYLGTGVDDKKRDLYKICKELGIVIYASKFNDDAMSGLIRRNGETWEIYVNDTDSPKRKVFTIAHELGHYFSFIDKKLSYNLLDSSGIHEDFAIFGRAKSNTKRYSPEFKEMEAEANFIAANLLMPENLVQAAFYENKNVEEMAEEFGVSESAMGFRLVNLGLMPIESVGLDGK